MNTKLYNDLSGAKYGNKSKYEYDPLNDSTGATYDNNRTSSTSRYKDLTPEQLKERFEKAPKKPKTLKSNRVITQSNYSSSLNNYTAPNHKYRSSSNIFHKKRVYSDVKCPCNQGNNCTGPRGGKFCITSGNKKRYRP